MYYLKGSKERIMIKYWSKAKPNTNWANSKLHIFMIDVKMFFRSLTPFTIVDSSTCLSFGLVPLSISNFSQQVPCISGISTILRSPRQARLHPVATLGLHIGIPLLYTWPQWLSLVSGRFHNSFLVFSTLNP